MTSYNPKLKKINNKLTISNSVTINGTLSGNVNLNSNIINTTTSSANTFQMSNVEINKPKTSIINVNNNTNLTKNNHMIFVDANAKNISILLPPNANTAQEYIIKKCDTTNNSVVIGNSYFQEARLNGSLATVAGDNFAIFVSLNSDGSKILVGANGDEPSGTTGNGLAYVFNSGSNGWTQEVILSGSLATVNGDNFGRSCALNSSGNLALVGATGDEPSGTIGNGLVYIFNSSSNGWSQQAILSGSLAVDSADNFGYSVAINSSGNVALIGAYGDESPGVTGNGLAYVFISNSSGWSQQAILSGNCAVDTDDYFGYSVALNSSGNIALIGAYGDEVVGSSNYGLAYVFISGSKGWRQTAAVTGNLATASSDSFGFSVALDSSGKIGLFGAYQDERSSTTGEGLTYIFNSVNNSFDSDVYCVLTGSYESVRLSYDGNGNWIII